MFKRKSDHAPPFGDIGSSDDDREIEIHRPKREANRHFWNEAGLFLRDIIFAALVAIMVIVFFVQPVKVEGSSMLPHLHDGERLFVNKLIYYQLPALQRGDIVVFWFPNDPSKSYVKRLIGLPGETVEVRDGRVLVNGQPLAEPYLDRERNRRLDDHLPVYIRPHHFYVMGDNRDGSSDSREWGLVPEKYIYGTAIARWWPLSEASVFTRPAEYGVTSPPSRPQMPVPLDPNDADEEEEN